jgi:glyoxylase I family protein
MIEIVRLHHVSFAVKDVAASRRFFGNVLGIPEIERPAFDFAGAWYGIGDRQMHLIEQPDASRETLAKLTRSDHMALEVKDMGAVRQALTDASIEFQVGTNEHLGFAQTFCTDPDGHTIEFIHAG